jgi:hypothetical protein
MPYFCIGGSTQQAPGVHAAESGEIVTESEYDDAITKSERRPAHDLRASVSCGFLALAP